MVQAQSLSAGMRQLLSEPAYGEIATVMPDGAPLIAQVWVDTDGAHVLINTTAKSQKVRNVRRDSRVAVNVVDPTNAWRLANIRGRVIEITTEGADAEIDRLAKKYLGQDAYPYKDPDNPRVTLVIDVERVREVGLDSGDGVR